MKYAPEKRDNDERGMKTMNEKTRINGKPIDGRKVPAIIRQQPGYSPKGDYRVSKAKSGGYRLYKYVSGQWMDASLEDVAELKQYAD